MVGSNSWAYFGRDAVAESCWGRTNAKYEGCWASGLPFFVFGICPGTGKGAESPKAAEETNPPELELKEANV